MGILIITLGPIRRGTPLHGVYRYVQRQRVWVFSYLMVINRELVLVILALLVINKAWFFHYSLELGMLFLHKVTFSSLSMTINKCSS